MFVRNIYGETSTYVLTTPDLFSLYKWHDVRLFWNMDRIFIFINSVNRVVSGIMPFELCVANNDSHNVASNMFASVSLFTIFSHETWIHINFRITLCHLPWASYQIRKIAAAHAPGMPETSCPPPQESDPDMHHGTCVTHVPWCMLGSLTSGFFWSRRVGKTFPTFPAHAQPAILRIW